MPPINLSIRARANNKEVFQSTPKCVIIYQIRGRYGTNISKNSNHFLQPCILNACASFNVKNLTENPPLSSTCYLANGGAVICFDRPKINSPITAKTEIYLPVQRPSHDAKNLSGTDADDDFAYPPSLCAWMYRNMRDVNIFLAHKMALITLNSPQELSMPIWIWVGILQGVHGARL